MLMFKNKRIYSLILTIFMIVGVFIIPTTSHAKSQVLGIPEAQIKDTAVIDLINRVQLEVTGADIAAVALFQPGDVNISFNPDIRGYNYDMFQGVD